MAFPKIGNLAPAFSLKNQDGKTVSLKDFKGRSTVVLYFYPAAMTPGCTVQACGLRDTAKALAALDAVALGVSPDPEKKLQKFIERDRLNFDLLSDPEHEVAREVRRVGPEEVHGPQLRRHPAHHVHHRQGRSPAARDGQGQDQDPSRRRAGAAAHAD